jgi:hypothetical protein
LIQTSTCLIQCFSSGCHADSYVLFPRYTKVDGLLQQYNDFYAHAMDPATVQHDATEAEEEDDVVSEEPMPNVAMGE